MDGKHTPGPWTVRPACDGSGDVGITALGLPNVIAECFEDIRAYGECATDEAKANAHLIAAAPDLYEALKNITSGLFDDEDSKPLILAREVKAARAALAKAQGREGDQ